MRLELLRDAKVRLDRYLYWDHTDEIQVLETSNYPRTTPKSVGRASEPISKSSKRYVYAPTEGREMRIRWETMQGVDFDSFPLCHTFLSVGLEEKI